MRDSDLSTARTHPKSNIPLRGALIYALSAIFVVLIGGRLIAVFTAIPYLQMHGRPLILLDVVHREFTLFGTTFLPTDSVLLMLLLVQALQRLVPALRPEDVTRGGAGVRAQAVSPDGSLVDDFRILAEADAIHVPNAPSPGATASIAIGRHIAGLAVENFGLK